MTGLLVILVHAGPALAEKRQREIAYACAPFSANDQEICVVRPDGSGRRVITHNGAFDSDPAWSPDGSLLAFTSDRADGPGGDVHIWVMAAHGGLAYRVSSTPGFAPTWSPDGRSIVFVATESVRLRVVDMEGERDLTSGADWELDPSWSTTGLIAFTGLNRSTGTTDVFTVPDSGGTPTNLTPNFPTSDRDPDWSPDGSELAFASDRATPFEEEIWLMRADGSDPRRLTDSPGPDLSPSWSPNGSRIVFTSYRDQAEPGVGSELYVMQADGSSPRRITFVGGFNGVPDWSPAGLPAQ